MASTTEVWLSNNGGYIVLGVIVLVAILLFVATSKSNYVKKVATKKSVRRSPAPAQPVSNDPECLTKLGRDGIPNCSEKNCGALGRLPGHLDLSGMAQGMGIDFVKGEGPSMRCFQARKGVKDAAAAMNPNLVCTSLQGKTACPAGTPYCAKIDPTLECGPNAFGGINCMCVS